MPKYRITIDGATYEVSSPTPLTDAEAYAHVKTQHEASGGNFSGSGTTKNVPANQGPPDPWADLRARGEGILSQDERPHTEPTPGMDGFVKGLTGNSDLHFSGDQSLGHAAGDLLSAENAGAVLHDAGTMAAGLLVPGGLKMGGKMVEGAGTLMEGGRGAFGPRDPITGKMPTPTAGQLAMRATALGVRGTIGHQIGGIPGEVAAAVAPPMLRGFGRIMQRTGEAMSSSPEPAEPILPQYRDLGNVPQYTDLGNPNAPGPSAPRPPPAQLAAAPSGPFPSPPSSMGPARGFLAEAPPPKMPPPSLATEQQAAMLEQVNGPAPLGSLPPGQSPRVKAWKPGFGPSAGDAEVLRNAYGSKQAGSILKTPGDQVKTLAPTDGPPALPAQVSDSLGQQFLSASPEVRQQLLSTASPLVKQLFLSLAEQSP